MWDGEIIVNSVKVEGVVQILAVAVVNAFLESKMAGVGCGSALGAWPEPKLRLLRPRRSRCLLWRQLSNEHIEHDPTTIRQEEKMKARVPSPLDVPSVISRRWNFNVVATAACQHPDPKNYHDARKQEGDDFEDSLHARDAAELVIGLTDVVYRTVRGLQSISASVGNR